jgi:lambda family phage portal protein
MAKLIDKLAASFGFSRMVEAANWRPEERAWVQAQAQDSKVDISNGDRTRLLGLSRKLFYNNAIVRSAIRDKATYSVGAGITPQANSGDPAWDDAAEAWWADWSKSPEISGRHDMRRLQMLVSEAVDRDGEIFCILTNKGEGMPAVQIVESHRVANPPDKLDEIVDGVTLDRYARPLAYHVVEGDSFNQRTSRAINADLMLHVYEPERPDQVRGYPAVAVALNNLLDRDELLRFEMQAAKIGSSIGLVIQNATGATGAEGFFGDLSKQNGESLTRETVFGGGMIPRLKATERVESFMMNRPNEKLDAHLEQYIRAAALGLGLPYEFIWDTSAVGGVAQRFIIQKAARAFSARQDVLIASFLGKLWTYAIANAIRSGQLPANPNWRRVEWQTPRSITVDVGREAQARRDDVKAGLMTLADFFGEQGLDWKTAMQEIAAERQFASDLGIVVGVERTEGATVIDPALPAGDGGSTPPASTNGEFAALDCGTGAGGFKPGNDCARSGASGKKKDSKKTVEQLAAEIKANGVANVELPKNALANQAADAISLLKEKGYDLPESITAHNFESKAFGYGGSNRIGLSKGRISEADIQKGVASGWIAQGNIVLHEHGHNLHQKSAGDSYDRLKSWPYRDSQRPIAAKVSRYAASNPVEFVAETFGAHVSGKTIPEDVRRLYVQMKGPELK